MQINQLTQTLAALLGYANTQSITKNTIASQILEQTLKETAPAIKTDTLTSKAKQIIDLLA